MEEEDILTPEMLEEFWEAVDGNSLEYVKQLMMEYRRTRSRQFCARLVNYNGEALHVAIDNNNLEMVRFLIEECEADVNHKDERGNNTFLWACQLGSRRSIIRYLLSETEVDLTAVVFHGSTTDRRSTTAVTAAIENNDLELLKMLVDGHSLNIHADQNMDGLCPLSCCLANGYVDMAKYYISKDGIPDNYSHEGCQSYVHAAVSSNQLDAVRFAVEVMGDDPHVCCDNHLTAVHIASRGHTEVLQYLTDPKGTVRVKVHPGPDDDWHTTPLHIAAKRHDQEKIVYLIQRCGPAAATYCQKRDASGLTAMDYVAKRRRVFDGFDKNCNCSVCMIARVNSK